MGIFKKYVNQTRKPEGFLGRMMVNGMAGVTIAARTHCQIEGRIGGKIILCNWWQKTRYNIYYN